MDQPTESLKSRREFIKTTTKVAAVSALAGIALPHVHAAGSDTIQVALIGCGGRGTGAAQNALRTSKQGPIKLVAMADVFENRLNQSYSTLSKAFTDGVDVPKDRQFIGFDAYAKAMDCLKAGDVAIFTTPPAFRWVNYTHAIKKGLNVFMEKPVTVDGPSSRRMLKLNEEAKAKSLKVGVGLMSRHSKPLQEVHKRIQDGEIGDLLFMRGYRCQGKIGTFYSLPKPPGINETLYQLQRFHSFLWASGGCFSDFYIHHIDHCCWMKNSLPVKAQALGGRHYRKSPEGPDYVDQNFDTYSVEYTFNDGAKLFFDGRCMEGALPIYNSAAHGSKGMAVLASHSDCGAPSRIFKGQNPAARSNMLWQSTDQSDPYQNEWETLVDAIRNNKPHNEVQSGVETSLVTSMGRMAAHTGQEITYEEMLNCEHEFAPEVDKLTMDSPAPLIAGKDGKYPIPMPGIQKKREY